jgi:hypothetical protein
MTRTEKLVSQKLSDSISQQAALLKSLGFDCSDILETLRDINEALITMKTTDELGPLPTFEEHNEFVRQSINSGAMG